MLELAHRLPVDLRLSTAGPRSGPRPGNTDQPRCKFIQELESGGIGIFDFSPNPLSHRCSFSRKLFHLARSNSPEHLLLLILLKTLQCWWFYTLFFFFWDVLFYFAAIFCIAMQKVKDGGWMALGMDGSRDGGLKDGISFWLEALFAVFPWLRLPTFRSFWYLFVCSLSSQSTIVRLTLLHFNKA